MVRALASHQCGPGSIPRFGVIWVVFVVGSRPCSDGFYPGSPVFRPPQNQHFQIPIRPGTHGHLNLNEILVLFGASWVNKLRLHFLHLQILALLEEVVI